MDERQFKRLLVIVAVSIVIIMISKMMLTRTVGSLSKAAEVRKQTAPATPVIVQTESFPEPAQEVEEIPDTSTGDAESIDSPASGVSGTEPEQLKD